MAYYDTNFLTFQGNVANTNIQTHQSSRSNKTFAFITLINHAGNKETTAEFQGWGTQAVNLTRYNSGDKVKVKARLNNGMPVIDQNGYKNRTIVSTIISSTLVFAKGQRSNGNRQQTTNDPFGTQPNGKPANNKLRNNNPFAHSGNNRPANSANNAPQGSQGDPGMNSADLKALEKQQDEEAEQMAKNGDK